MASDGEASCESDPNFAVICGFLEKFGITCGLKNVDFLDLQEMLENHQEVPQELVNLHVKLLRKARKSVSSERWERAIIKLCHGFSSQDAWEIERFGYKKARLSSKLRILKELLEMQFDFNAKFKSDVNKLSAEELRTQPLGKDRLGHAYWYQTDDCCQVRIYKEDLDEETWALVAKDREGLVSVISQLNTGDSVKIGCETVTNEDSNSLESDKPVVDTGQPDSNLLKADTAGNAEGEEKVNEAAKEEEIVTEDVEDKPTTNSVDNNLSEKAEPVADMEKTDSNTELLTEDDKSDADVKKDSQDKEDTNGEKPEDIQDKEVTNGDKPNIEEDTKSSMKAAINLRVKPISELISQSTVKPEYAGIKGKYIRGDLFSDIGRIPSYSSPVLHRKAVESAGFDTSHVTPDLKRPYDDEIDIQPSYNKRPRLVRPTLLGNKKLQKSYSDEDDEDEVEDEIEEPPMIFRGEGTGMDNNADNEEVSPVEGDTIEEAALYIYGDGSGHDCKTGNEKPPPSEQNAHYEKCSEQNLTVNSSVSSNSNEEASNSRINEASNSITNLTRGAKLNDNSPYYLDTKNVKEIKLGTIIDVRSNHLSPTLKSPIKKSRWDVRKPGSENSNNKDVSSNSNFAGNEVLDGIYKMEPEAQVLEPQNNISKLTTTLDAEQQIDERKSLEKFNKEIENLSIKPESNKDVPQLPKKSMFFFGPGCLTVSPSKSAEKSVNQSDQECRLVNFKPDALKIADIVDQESESRMAYVETRPKDDIKKSDEVHVESIQKSSEIMHVPDACSSALQDRKIIPSSTTSPENDSFTKVPCNYGILPLLPPKELPVLQHVATIYRENPAKGLLSPPSEDDNLFVVPEGRPPHTKILKPEILSTTEGALKRNFHHLEEKLLKLNAAEHGVLPKCRTVPEEKDSSDELKTGEKSRDCKEPSDSEVPSVVSETKNESAAEDLDISENPSEIIGTHEDCGITPIMLSNAPYGIQTKNSQNATTIKEPCDLKEPAHPDEVEKAKDVEASKSEGSTLNEKSKEEMFAQYLKESEPLPFDLKEATRHELLSETRKQKEPATFKDIEESLDVTEGTVSKVLAKNSEIPEANTLSHAHERENSPTELKKPEPSSEVLTVEKSVQPCKSFSEHLKSVEEVPHLKNPPSPEILPKDLTVQYFPDPNKERFPKDFSAVAKVSETDQNKDALKIASNILIPDTKNESLPETPKSVDGPLDYTAQSGPVFTKESNVDIFKSFTSTSSTKSKKELKIETLIKNLKTARVPVHVQVSNEREDLNFVDAPKALTTETESLKSIEEPLNLKELNETKDMKVDLDKTLTSIDTPDTKNESSSKEKPLELNLPTDVKEVKSSNTFIGKLKNESISESFNTIAAKESITCDAALVEDNVQASESAPTFSMPKSKIESSDIQLNTKQGALKNTEKTGINLLSKDEEVESDTATSECKIAEIVNAFEKPLNHNERGSPEMFDKDKNVDTHLPPKNTLKQEEKKDSLVEKPLDRQEPSSLEIDEHDSGAGIIKFAPNLAISETNEELASSSEALNTIEPQAAEKHVETPKSTLVEEPKEESPIEGASMTLVKGLKPKGFNTNENNAILQPEAEKEISTVKLNVTSLASSDDVNKEQKGIDLAAILENKIEKLSDNNCDGDSMTSHVVEDVSLDESKLSTDSKLPELLIERTSNKENKNMLHKKDEPLPLDVETGPAKSTHRTRKSNRNRADETLPEQIGSKAKNNAGVKVTRKTKVESIETLTTKLCQNKSIEVRSVKVVENDSKDENQSSKSESSKNTKRELQNDGLVVVLNRMPAIKMKPEQSSKTPAPAVNSRRVLRSELDGRKSDVIQEKTDVSKEDVKSVDEMQMDNQVANKEGAAPKKKIKLSAKTTGKGKDSNKTAEVVEKASEDEQTLNKTTPATDETEVNESSLKFVRRRLTRNREDKSATAEIVEKVEETPKKVVSKETGKKGKLLVEPKKKLLRSSDVQSEKLVENQTPKVGKRGQKLPLQDEQENATSVTKVGKRGQRLPSKDEDSATPLTRVGTRGQKLASTDSESVSSVAKVVKRGQKLISKPEEENEDAGSKIGKRGGTNSKTSSEDERIPVEEPICVKKNVPLLYTEDATSKDNNKKPILRKQPSRKKPADSPVVEPSIEKKVPLLYDKDNTKAESPVPVPAQKTEEKKMPILSCVDISKLKAPPTIPEEKPDMQIFEPLSPDLPGVPDSPDNAVISDSSSDIIEVPETDPLAVVVEPEPIKTSGLTLSMFKIDVEDEIPAIRMTRKRAALQSIDALKQSQKPAKKATKSEINKESFSGKRSKMHGKRSMDRGLRRSIEEQKKLEISSSDEEDGEKVKVKESPRKKGSSAKKSKGEVKQQVAMRAKLVASPIVVSSDAPSESSRTMSTPPVSKKSKPKRKKLILMGLEIPDTQPGTEDSDAMGVRQSRRIAQIKIKEEAERRKIEEITMCDITDERKKRKSKKGEDKEYKAEKRKRNKQHPPTEEETSTQDVESDEKKKMKRKRKHKDPRKLFDESNPWKSSSGSSTSELEEEEDEEPEPSEDEHHLLRSDHEFSPESDLEAGEVQPLKRARTARKESDADEEEVDDRACQKCSKSDHPEWILLCDTCDCGWHCSCLRPALLVIPEGDWFCPACQHTTLIKQLEEKLVDYDKKRSKREMEVRRKERLAYVGISLDNVLPTKDPDDHRHKRSRQELEIESEESDDSASSSSSDSDSEPIYQLRARRQAHSYRFNDYDELINSAIQDELEAGKGAGNQGRGKDITTIINAEKEEAALQAVNAEPVLEPLPPVVPPNYDRQPEGHASDEDQIQPVKKRLIGRKKHRKLNSLEDSSGGEQGDSDEDFKGSSSSESEEDFDEGDSENSDDNRRGKRRNDSGPVRRSTRARISRYDRDFVNDDSSSEEAPRRKKTRSAWDESESEESDRSWGRRTRKTGSSRRRFSNPHPKKSKKKKKKKKRNTDDSDGEVYRRKPRIIFGGLNDDDDEEIGRRTRGKKINYLEALGTDSDDDARKKPAKVVESEEEYVVNEEEELQEALDNDKDSDDNISGTEEPTPEEQANLEQQDDTSKPPQGRGKAGVKRIRRIEDSPPPELEPVVEPMREPMLEPMLQPMLEPILEPMLEPISLPPPELPEITETLEEQDFDDEPNPIEEINKNIEEMDEKEMEKLMEEEDYANKQLQLVALQIEKEKKRKEREAKRLEKLAQKEQKVPKKRGRKPKLQPVFNPMEEVVATDTFNRPSLFMSPEMQNNTDLSEPPGITSLPLFHEMAPLFNADATPRKRRGRGKGKKTLAAEQAAASGNLAKDSLDMQSSELTPLSSIDSSSSPILDASLHGSKLGIATPPQPFSQNQPTPSVITRMLQSQTAAGGYPAKYFAGDGRLGHAPLPTSPGGVYLPPASGPYQHPPPVVNRYSGIRGAVPPNMPPMYHSHRSLDPSPSGGGPINVANTSLDRRSPAVVSPAPGSPLSKGEPIPPPPYSHPQTSHFPPGVPPVARHVPLVASPHLQPRPGGLGPFHHGIPPNYHYGQYPPPLINPEDAPPVPAYPGSPYSEPFAGETVQPENGKGFDEETGGEFGGLVSYFSSQREDDLDT